MGKKGVCLHGQTFMPVVRAEGRGLANIQEETDMGVWLEKC